MSSWLTRLCVAWLLLSSLGWTQVPVLAPGDRVNLQVFALPELTQNYTIGGNGCINHPLLGEVKAAGKTLSQLTAVVKQRLVQTLRKPGFSLSLAATAEIEVAILGEVKSQGKYWLIPGSTWLDLLNQAGGATSKGDLQSSILMRDDKEISIFGSSETLVWCRRASASV